MISVIRIVWWQYEKSTWSSYDLFVVVLLYSYVALVDIVDILVQHNWYTKVSTYSSIDGHEFNRCKYCNTSVYSVLCKWLWKASVNYRFVLIYFLKESKQRANTLKHFNPANVKFYAEVQRVSFFRKFTWGSSFLNTALVGFSGVSW